MRQIHSGKQFTYFAQLLVQTMYSISSVYGFWKLKQLMRSHTQSWFLAQKRYITETAWPFSFSTKQIAICTHAEFIFNSQLDLSRQNSIVIGYTGTSLLQVVMMKMKSPIETTQSPSTSCESSTDRQNQFLRWIVSRSRHRWRVMHRWTRLQAVVS